MLDRATAGTGIDPALLEGLVFVESAGRPQVIAGSDPADAAGLTQILESRGFTILHSAVDLPSLEAALRDPSADAAVVDVRLPPAQTDEGLRAALEVRSRRP